MKATVKYTAIRHHAGKYPIKQMCAFFGVSRSGYYVFIKRKSISQHEQELVQWIASARGKPTAPMDTVVCASGWNGKGIKPTIGSFKDHEQVWLVGTNTAHEKISANE
ncbi:MAG: hypothetical protein EOM62_19715 [Bacteroidia bacterium]|nr:hypothetical protein [Bacteroidia bacterium]